MIQIVVSEIFLQIVIPDKKMQIVTTVFNQFFRNNLLQIVFQTVFCKLLFRTTIQQIILPDSFFANCDNCLQLCSGNLRQCQAMMAKSRNLMSLSNKDLVLQQIWNDFSMDTTGRKVMILYSKSKNPSCFFYLMICRLDIFNMLMCEVQCKSHTVLPSSLLSE